MTVTNWLASHNARLADGRMLLDVMRPLFDNLRHLWGFLRMSTVTWTSFKAWRDAFLLAWLATGESTLRPAFHYLTNHLWEDFIRWGCLYAFLGEAGEAAHARDNRMSAPTVRGRPLQPKDPYNTWCVLIRNFYAMMALSTDATYQKYLIRSVIT